MTLEYLEIMEATTQQQQQQPQPVPRKIRGTLTIKAEDDMEFRAERRTGLSSQIEIARTAAGKLYEPVGKDTKYMMAHIAVPKTEADPRAFLYDAVEKLTRGMQSKAQPRLQGRVLLDADRARVVLNRKEKKIEIVLGIDLSMTLNCERELMKLMYQVNQCLVINQTSIASARK